MKKQLNAAQAKQFESLAIDTNQAFSDLILDHTFFVSESELDVLIEETNLMMDDGECYEYSFDENFYSVACEYSECDHEAIKIEFNRVYGIGSFYIDTLGRGLIVSIY